MSEAVRIRQPNSRHCFACGLENPYGLAMTFYEVPPDVVESSVVLPERFQGYPGIAHGGIVAAMLDEMVSRAGMIGDPTHFVVTARLEIRYRKPVPVGQPLALRGRLLRRKGRIATAEAELRLPDGSVAAEAEALLADFPDMPDDPERLRALGWRVYQDEEIQEARGP